VPHKTKAPEGIEVRHANTCRSREGGRCTCDPTYRAHVWSNGDRRRIRQQFDTLPSAKAWRREVQMALDRGTLLAPSPLTLGEVAEAWVQGARDGSIRSSKGEPYRASSVRGYERCLRLRILPALGAMKLSDVKRRHVQALVEAMLADGLDGSTVVNTLNPLQAIYRRAIRDEEVAVNPTVGVDLPRQRGRRERVASPEEAAALIDAVPPADRALWATAMYAGLRRGELRALRLADVDLASGVIRVERGWDDEDGEIDGKTRAARRAVPISGALRDHLLAHKLALGRADGLIFGTSATAPFQPTNLRRRALTAWERAGLAPIGLHESRHTFASLMIAAGVNAKALSTYMGHASVQITFDRYGHLMPGNEQEAADLLDAYLVRTEEAAGA